MAWETRFFRTAKYAIVAIILVSIIWGYTSEPLKRHSFTFTYPILEKGWSQVIDGVSTPLDDVQAFIPVPTGEPLIFETTLQALHSNSVLFFRTKNREVRVFVDDCLVHEFVMQERFAFLQTPGNMWNEVFLDTEMQGKTLRVELVSHSAYYNNLLFDFYFIHHSQVLGLILQWIAIRLVTGLFLFIIAIISYMNGGIWNGTATRRYVIFMADFYMVLALWVFANAGVFDALIYRPLISYFIEMFSVRLIPIMAFLFARNILNRHYYSMTVAGWIVYIHFFASVLLQFVFGISFLDTLWMVHVLFVVGAILDFSIIAHHLYRTRHEPSERNYLLICTGILFVSAIAEVCRFYLIPESYIFISVYIGIAYLMYTIIAHIVLVHRSAGLDKSISTLETHYNKLQNTALLRKINAHFFFNVLNGISAMCKENPTKADESITLLAQYMRHYTYLSNISHNVQFINELDFIRIYLKIEQMRFSNGFTVQLQTDFTNFAVPPLSIQPIVENAIMRNLRQCEYHGTLTIRSKRIRDNAVITIQDTGAGFDMRTLLEQETHALSQLRKRLATMAQGTLDVNSKLGVGTTVTISIPITQYL